MSSSGKDTIMQNYNYERISQLSESEAEEEWYEEYRRNYKCSNTSKKYPEEQIQLPKNNKKNNLKIKLFIIVISISLFYLIN